ncbi:hypothetical protein NLI96_g12776 [Meripilus lineatus]|uniref:Uncharacterized protein n=1 Tax=Meripilus lineatus TaxID=2056292 RepID=A0AAD5UTY4_9APHY|nr:hypothetical protein NLI96_g12776 [Physisporinus lineatus]
MIAIQKPSHPFMIFQHFQPSHHRNPSAPVVVRATHTPGLLSLAKQQTNQVPRPQQLPSYTRPHKPSPKSKTPRAPHQPSRQAEEVKKSSAHKQPPADENKVPASISTPEKQSRGRQSSKPAAKDKADRRSISLSSRPQHRRRPHQPSPSPTRIPKQTDATAEASRPASVGPSVSDSNLSDPFLVQPTDDSSEAPKQTATKTSAKPLAFRPPPSSPLAPSASLLTAANPL